MNCHEINKGEFHERYLLGKLTKEESEAYLEHISACEKCLQEQLKLKKIISGIRFAGKTGMKTEIEKQIIELKEQSKNEWKYFVLKAAAVLIIAVFVPGLYYYYELNFNETVSQNNLSESPITEIDESLDYDYSEIMDSELPTEQDKSIKPKSVINDKREPAIAEGIRQEKKDMEQERNKISSVKPAQSALPIVKEAIETPAEPDIETTTGFAAKRMKSASSVNSIEQNPSIILELEDKATEVLEEKQDEDIMRSLSEKKALGKTYPLQNHSIDTIDQNIILRLVTESLKIEFITNLTRTEQKHDSTYAYSKTGDILKVYWNDIPEKYIKNSNSLSAEEIENGKILIKYNDTIEHQIEVINNYILIKAISD
ncbi:MAG: hypothetical protein JXR46_11295 [Calditrichaceae bacterium]|nr:hypothetical protein [Calditrichaceae bacterium]MBN2709619.1 hypothetical protein [Calditrichaceae bacterium]RQV92416.1 MAG: hypothetical protein EH224_15560 [Calditrichota bacterium]